MGELARLTHMDPGATARQIGQLEKDGLVRRYPSPDDGRVNLVVLTRRGDAVRGRIASVLDGHLIRVLAGWSEQDQAVFAGLLSRFVDDMRARAYVPAEEESPAGTG
jgi:DNA-binding MarR family transcriptional regulator